MVMARWLAVASVAWPLVAGAAVWQRSVDPAAPWTTIVYLAASRVCHQRPERSFHTALVQWPVCGRCSGIYLGASVGAVLAGAPFARRLARRGMRWPVVWAGVPTLVTFVMEWLGVGALTNATRAMAALPLGAACAAAIVSASTERTPKAIG
jgi:uncharacterized membrane protein